MRCAGAETNVSIELTGKEKAFACLSLEDMRRETIYQHD